MIAFGPVKQRGTMGQGHVSPILQLPQELIPEVLCHLKGDRTAMWAASLISRVWLVEGRRIFFRRLSVDVERLRYFSLPSFRHTTGTEILVREIHLYSPSESRYTRVSLANIARVLSHFPAVEVLHISSAFWQLRSDPPSPFDWTRPRPTISLPSVKRVILAYKDQVPSHDNISALLHWFPALEELGFLRKPLLQDLDTVFVDHYPLPIPNFQLEIECSPASPTRLERIRTLFPLKSSRLFAASFAASTFAIDVDSDKFITAAAPILYDLGASLRHLIIKMPRLRAAYKSDPQELYSELNFSSCVNLQSLTISLNPLIRPSPDGPPTSIWDHIFHILGLVIGAASNTLSYITITVHSESVSGNVQRFLETGISSVQWSRFEDLLMLMGMERVEKVESKVQGLGRAFMRKVPAKLGESMPKLQKRGILLFS